ncbi:YjfB family protein [Niallia alba]|uniref:YjfB family protein n=1 Tax=Niallia circulans TaxID=1397 RepID=A0A941GKR5_NIACI|nr:YjfB family protein [Niallia circulans]MCB5238678.1 YjfB family protein [Niallia circulans]MDU1845396.1 YjfB family protein [Niallia nealsonii]
MDIAALSIGMNQATLSQNVSIALTKKAMDTVEQNSDQLIKMLEASHPTLGKSVDISV